MSQAVSLTDGVNRATRAEKAGKQFDEAFAALIKSLNQEVTGLKRKAAALNQEAAVLTRRAAVLNAPVKVLTTNPASSPSVA
jgi:phosphohistidine swiveling domain-containing protein